MSSFLKQTTKKSINTTICPLCKEGVQFILSLASTVSQIVDAAAPGHSEFYAQKDTHKINGDGHFHPSPDYRVISCRHGQFQFSKSQAAIVKVMHASYIKSINELHKSEILNSAGLDPSEDNLGKIFRSGTKKHPALGTLIVPVKGKRGFYRFNP